MRKTILTAAALLLAAQAPLRAQPAAPAQDLAAQAGVEALPATPGPEMAQAGPAAPSGLPDRAPPPRTLRAHWHVFVAFALAWVLLFGYAVSIGRRLGRVDRDVQRVGGAGT